MAAIMVVLLCGCARVSYPRLYTPPLPKHLAAAARWQGETPPPPIAEARIEQQSASTGRAESRTVHVVVRDEEAVAAAGDLDPIEQVIVAAYDSQREYDYYYRSSAQTLDESQIPLIAAAGIAALVLYNNPANASDYLAGLGVGSAFWSTTRSTLLPRRMPELYILGHSALGCIRAETPTFVGREAETTEEALRDKAAKFTRVLLTLRQLYTRARPSAGASEPQKTAFQSAMVALNDAVVAGNQTLTLSNRQLLALARADSVFGRAVANVHSRVALKARDGRIDDFGPLRQRFTDSIQAAGVPAASTGSGSDQQADEQADDSPGPPDTPEEQAQALLNALLGPPTPTDERVVTIVWEAARLLAMETQSLTSVTPDYIDVLTRVEACPSTIQ